MGKIAFIFPGQGSQTVGMGQSLANESEKSAKVFQKADERLGFSLSDIIFNGPSETLTLTENAQPALLTTSIAVLELLKEHGIKADFTAGHSLGEYTALVAAGAISFEDAVYAVRKRGEYMEEAVPAGVGTMAAILGMDESELQAVTEEVTAGGDTVQLANLNCPGQIVISGTKQGVEDASQLAKERGAKKVIPLVVSGPFHSILMKPAAEKFGAVLNEIEIRNAEIPVIANVTAQAMTESEDIKEKLIQQLYSPVRWEKSVETMLDLGVDTFIEIGPGKVLSGLVKKVNRRVNAYAISDQETLLDVVNKLKGDA
ncbi:ACP S-malonyltransferase [Schinkia azotoformans]|uniref:Malonyl CoA-acyl carrier protein transacylase n=1 Tax=Schinkia azotoformans LMG 9581 TaxID=1131731 RepID=K6D6A8_SCHAZ|nr:ACP S-malonyltransferase [Schinkia azotoformans]EKN63844.1 malonyl CoA-acyl carrier protein transacylase [Schinkia azotoformans LMG 9581]MEC1638286.1 ACP S-malonyltransferase [Schinkia azotoformans]MEC1946280.1 ACP S-malonyltransferase [Schinkia azotoformans]